MNLFGDIFSADRSHRDPSSTGRIPRIRLDNPPSLPYGKDTSLEWIDFSQTLNPLGTPAPIRRAIHNITNSSPSDNEEALYHELPLLIARRLGISAENVAVGPSIPSILGIIASVMKPCAVGLSEPSRAGYAPTFKSYGHQIVEIPSIDGLAVPNPLTFAEDGIQFNGAVLANPTYPSSRLLSNNTLELYCQNYSWVVVDERGIDLTLGGESVVPFISKYPNLIVVQTLTDTFAIPDITFAYCLATPQVISYIEPMMKRPESVALAHSVAKESLNLSTYLDNTRDVLEREIPWMQCMLSLIPGMTIFPAEANYVLCSFQPKEQLNLGAENTVELVSKLQERGFMVRPLEHTPGLAPQTYFCVAVKTHKQNEQLIHAIRAIVNN